jgi:predicted amidohydrolase
MADVTECMAETGAEIFVVPNGSPYEVGKEDVRLNLIVARVAETGLPMAYLNQVGGQDELVFDGASLVVNADKSLAWAACRHGRTDRRDRVAAPERGLGLRARRGGARPKSVRSRSITP